MMRGRGLIGTDEVRRKWKVWELLDWMWLLVGLCADRPAGRACGIISLGTD